MKNTFRRKQVIIKNCTESNDDFMRLYYIFRSTLRPDMAFREFTLYYYSKKLEYIDVTFLYHENLVAGFCAAAFYSFNSTGQLRTIGRSATGFLEDYQGKALPKWVLYYKYIRYKQSHPFKQLILTAYVANPLVYSMICKYTGIVYPRHTVQADEKIVKMKEQVLSSSGLSKRESTPFAVKIHFDVQKGEKLLQRIKDSSDKHVQFFIEQTHLQPQITLLVIIPVSWLNITLTSGRFVRILLLKSYMKWTISFKVYLVKGKHNSVEIFNLAVQYCKKAHKEIENGNWKRLRTLFTK